MRRIVVAAAGAAVIMMSSACTPAAEPAARAAAQEFQTAVRAQRMPAACALMSDQTRQNLESAAASSCDRALARLKLADDEVGKVSVWGDNAQAKVGGTALFLADFSTGWKVTGVGCVFQAEDLPYDCLVEG